MGMIGIFSGLNISASGMRAQRTRQNAISSNIANADATRTEEGGPYRKKFVMLEGTRQSRDSHLVEQEKGISGTSSSKDHFAIPGASFLRDTRFFGDGVRVSEIRQDERPPKMVHNPGHPDADKNGYVAMPNVNIVTEMADMISASRAYEANATAFSATKDMLMQAIRG